jgi:hypothetical protein
MKDNQNDDRYARLIGYVDEDEKDYIGETIKRNPHIEWKEGHTDVYYIYLTKDQYNRQMMMPDRGWSCPVTGLGEDFDDEYFEEHNDQ